MVPESLTILSSKKNKRISIVFDQEKIDLIVASETTWDYKFYRRNFSEHFNLIFLKTLQLQWNLEYSKSNGMALLWFYYHFYLACFS